MFIYNQMSCVDVQKNSNSSSSLVKENCSNKGINKIFQYYRGYIILDNKIGIQLPSFLEPQYALGKRLYFVLDTQTGLLRCFVNPTKVKPIHNYFLQDCELRDTDTFTGGSQGSLECFEAYFIKKKLAMLIIPESGTNAKELKIAFDYCTKVLIKVNVIASTT